MPDMQGVSPTQILIADDSILTRQVMKKHMGNIYPEAVLTEAKDGAQAIDAIKEARLAKDNFDLIMLDYMMPEKTGLEVLAFIRETDQQVPVFIISANIQDAIREEAMELGCTDFIRKTLKAEDLCAGLGLKLSSLPCC